MLVFFLFLYRSNVSISMKIQDKSITSITKKFHLVKPQIQQTKKEEIQTSDDIEISDITESTLSRMNACDIGKLLVLIKFFFKFKFYFV